MTEITPAPEKLWLLFYEHRPKPLNLLGCMEVPEMFKPYVNDYKINLFEIAYLTEEQAKLFKSDFGIVADYFTQMRRNRDYHPEPQKIRHVQETLQLLSVMTHDQRYEDAYNNAEKGALGNMCEVLDRIENRGIARGVAIGEAQGEARGEARGKALGEEKKARETAQRLYAMGLGVDNIALAVGYAVDVIKSWLGLLPA